MCKCVKFLIIFGAVIALLAGIFVFYIQPRYVPPIAMYHLVNPRAKWPYRLAVKPQTLEKQMRFLRRHHYNVVPLETLAQLIREKKKIPPKTIALTFDDGYEDDFTYVFPLLKKYNMPATLFLIVNEIGQPTHMKLNWDQIKLMQDSDLITFGSHCLGPEPLVNITSEATLEREIFDSKKILEQKLGRPVTLFAYPEGLFNDHIRQLIIDAGYTVAVATNPGRRFPNNDVFALKRIKISENAANPFVFWWETNGYYNFFRELHKSKRQ